MSSVKAQRASSLIGMSNYRGWMSVIGGVIIHFSLGSLYTWGNLSTYVFSYMREVEGMTEVRYKDAVWILSAVFGAQALFMPLGGFAERFVGPKWGGLIGCSMMSLGVFVSQWTIKNFVFFVLTYGFLFGAGLGFAYTSPLVCALRWFPSQKGLMSGIITAGFGAGAIVFNQFQTFYINPRNVQPTYIPYPDFSQEKYFDDINMLANVPRLIWVSSCIYFSLQVIGCSLLANPPVSSSPSSSAYMSASFTSPIETIISVETDRSSSVGETHHLLRLKNDTPPNLAVRTLNFWYIWLMFFFNGLGISYIATYWKIIASSGVVMSDRYLSLVGSFGGLCNAAGRMFWGNVADRWSYSSALALLSSTWGVLIVLLAYYRHTCSAYTFIVCANFFCLGGNFACFPAITAAVFGNKYFGTVYGFVFFSQLASSLLMAFLSQTLCLLIGWIGLSSVVGGCCGASFLLALFLSKQNSGLGENLTND